MQWASTRPASCPRSRSASTVTVAPSTALRKWYNHDPERFEEFVRRYRTELQDPGRAAALEHLRELLGFCRARVVGTVLSSV